MSSDDVENYSSKEEASLLSHEADNQRMRVVMVAACPFPANHGTPGAIRELALHLVKQGHEVHVVAYPQSEDIDVEGLHIHRVRIPFFKPGPITIGPSIERIFFDMFMVPKLIKVIKRHKIDVIHAHNYEANIAGAMAKWVTGRPLIYNAVTAMADELPSYGFIRPDGLARYIGKALDWIVPRMSNVIMVLSDELKDYLVGLGNREEKVLVIPPGVETEWLSSGDGMKVRNQLQVDAQHPVVLYTGALEAFQRIDYLLQAMGQVVNDIPDALLVIAANVNNDAALNEYRAMVSELGIETNVRFINSVALAELPDYLDAATVAVVPRPSCPGYPIKLLNYMAASKPVVSFAGSAKALVHGYSGYVAPDHDVSDLASGITLLLSNSETATKLGERGRRSLEGVFDWETLARGVVDVYIQLVENKKQLSEESLARHLKRSYTPRLEGQTRESDFVIDGQLVYPAFQKN